MKSPLENIGPYTEVPFGTIMVPDPRAYIPGDSILLAQEEEVLRNVDIGLLLLGDLSSARYEDTGVNDGISDLVYTLFETLEKQGNLLPSMKRRNENRAPRRLFENWIVARLLPG